MAEEENELDENQEDSEVEFKEDFDNEQDKDQEHYKRIHSRQGFRWALLQEELFPNGEYNITEGIGLPQGVLLRTIVGGEKLPTSVALLWLDGVDAENFSNSISHITVDEPMEDAE